MNARLLRALLVATMLLPSASVPVPLVAAASPVPKDVVQSQALMAASRVFNRRLSRGILVHRKAEVSLVRSLLPVSVLSLVALVAPVSGQSFRSGGPEPTKSSIPAPRILPPLRPAIVPLGKMVWEPELATPWVVTDDRPGPTQGRRYIFSLDAHFLTAAPRFPKKRYEIGIAHDTRRVLDQNDPLPWPVEIFFAETKNLEPGHLAHVERITIQEPNGVRREGAAIIFTDAFWISRANKNQWESHLDRQFYAFHEKLHAILVWEMAYYVVARADAILDFLERDGYGPLPNSNDIQRLLLKVLQAESEVQAVDFGFMFVPMPPLERTKYDEYRSRNATLRNSHLNALARFLYPKKEQAKKAKAFTKWLEKLVDLSFVVSTTKKTAPKKPKAELFVPKTPSKAILQSA